MKDVNINMISQWEEFIKKTIKLNKKIKGNAYGDKRP